MISETRLFEITEELKNIDWFTIGLAEMRTENENYLELGDGTKTYFNERVCGVGSTGCIIRSDCKLHIMKFKSYTHWTSSLLLKDERSCKK